MSRKGKTLSLPARVYLWGVALAGGGALILWLWIGLSPPELAPGQGDLPLFLILTAAAVLAQHLPLHLGPQRKMDVVHGIYFAGLLLFGPSLGVALAGAGHLLGQSTLALRRNPQTGCPRGSRRGLLFNTGQMMLATALAGLAYFAVTPRGAPAPLEHPQNLWALPLAAAVLYLVNSFLVAGMAGLQTGTSPMAVWRAGRDFDVLQFGAVYVVGVGLAVALRSPWGAWGALTVLAFLLLLGAIHIALWQELRLRTAAQEVGHRVQAAGREQRAFVRLAGHELRTPLTSVQGYARQMLDELDAGGALSPPRLRRALQVIDLNAGRLTRVVMQLQDALRLQQGVLPLERRPADVAEVVAGVLTTTSPAPGRRLEADLHGPAWAEVDVPRLAQVARSLLDVALRYAMPGETVAVSVCQTVSGEVQVVVQEQGKDVPEEFRDHIRRRFMEMENGSRSDGLGLGLYVSRYVVQAHGGTIAVETPPEGGTRFLLTLPGLPLPSAAPRV
ncbi:MAG TPA: ATP-binding protein [Chloroflexota bacterium]|nr:ATP-binding protein [Chloroflexota bacterium]